MNNGISVLEEIGIKEVSKKTHIETKFLNYMVNKEFDKLNKINTMGYVKIIRREYGLDLDEWVEEYETYLEENGIAEIKNNTPIIAQEVNSKKPKNNTWIYILVAIILLILAFWKLGGINFINNMKYGINDQETTQAQATKTTPLENKTEKELPKKNQEPQKIANDKQNITKKEQNESSTNDKKDNIKSLVELNINQNTNKEKEIEATPKILDTNTSAKKPQTEQTEQVEQIKQLEKNNETDTTIQTETTDKLEQNSTKKEENSTQLSNEKEDKKNPVFKHKATIKPTNKIWLGYINTLNKKRTQVLTEKDIDINLSKPQLIITGHGNFTLIHENGEKEVRDSKKKQYFLVEYNTIKSIEKKEFKKLNGGTNW